MLSSQLASTRHLESSLRSLVSLHLRHFSHLSTFQAPSGALDFLVDCSYPIAAVHSATPTELLGNLSS